MSREGASSYHFRCRRSGRCCRVPDGFAFVDAGELAGLAEALGLELSEFTRRYLRSVVDPRTAEPRLALRDRPDGACSLLDGDNECTAYTARPKGCRDFPLWPSILGDERGLERAMRLCPGIEERPGGAALEAALAELAELYLAAPAPKRCAYPARGGESPLVTGLELEALLAAAGSERPDHGCPLETPEGHCGAPSAAPLACREAATDLDSSSPAPPAEENARLSDLAAQRDALEARHRWPRRLGRLDLFLAERTDPVTIELPIPPRP